MHLKNWVTLYLLRLAMRFLFICRMHVANDTLTRQNTICSDPNVGGFCRIAYSRLQKEYHNVKPVLRKYKDEQATMKKRKYDEALKNVDIIQVAVDFSEEQLRQSLRKLQYGKDRNVPKHLIDALQRSVAENENAASLTKSQLKKAKTIVEELK